MDVLKCFMLAQCIHVVMFHFSITLRERLAPEAALLILKRMKFCSSISQLSDHQRIDVMHICSRSFEEV